MMVEKKILFLFFGLLIIPSLSANVVAENTSFQIELTYPNGDRVPLGGPKLVITSQDGVISQEIMGKSSEPYFTVELPTNIRYKILVYVNDMLSGTKYLSLDDKTDQLIKIPINPSVGMKFFAYYEDGKTPIENALLELYSHKGNLIKVAKTDAEGKTLRFWVSSTIMEGEHYTAKVSISDNLVYESKKIRLGAGSADFDIITDWPATVDYVRINANLENYPKHSSEKNIVAKIFNDQFEKSATFIRESAHIPELRVGEYYVVVFDKNDPSVLFANQTILVDNNYAEYDVFIPQSTIESNEKLDQIPQNKSYSDVLEFSNDFSNLTWMMQSSSGNQIKNVNSDVFLRLDTDGDGDVVFTRSIFNETDLSDKKITISYYVDNLLSLKQFWVYFSHDNFESWYTYKIPISEITESKLIINTFQISDFNITGDPDPSKISQAQIRIKDNSIEPVTIHLFDFYSERSHSDTVTDASFSTVESCNCVAFRLDDVQDYFITDVQMALIEKFQQNDVDLTIGIIANNIGHDMDMTEFLSNISDKPGIEFANHGWDNEPITQFDTVGQEMLLLKSNNKIANLFGVKPTVFIPPQNSYDDETVAAMTSLGFTHLSSELDFTTPPFPLSGQTLYHFPETAFTGKLNEDRTQFVGLGAHTTFEQVEKSISEHGFAVVTLHPQEFSLFYNQNYQNKVNSAQVEQLEVLFSKLKERNIDTVLISEINTEPNQEILVPQWIKNNAKWWIENRVSTEEFLNSLEFLVSTEIIHVPQTEQTDKIFHIPRWIQQNIGWWVDGHISDSEFLSATEFLIQNGIIQI